MNRRKDEGRVVLLEIQPKLEAVQIDLQSVPIPIPAPRLNLKDKKDTENDIWRTVSIVQKRTVYTRL